MWHDSCWGSITLQITARALKPMMGVVQRKRRWEKNKVAAAPCQNKKKERKEFLQRESEWLELMNAELKQEWQQLILMLSWHCPTCIVRTDSVNIPDSEGNPLLEQLEKK
ncbi:Jun dimerization protein 2 [Myotis brandtii]|uniref:Jun dimerization protein 2 n=1 Tax=Myotis brandtii TaxID=109478 RepID=S7MMY6_MYOBR|nr:Jun dimerization protein 2 [Myotis brandtii]